MIFVDRQWPTCHGNGCDQCHETGSVGTCEESNRNVSTPVPTAFGDALRSWRLKHRMTFREMSAETGILPSVLSEIEIGRREPTEEQRRVLEEVMR